MLLAVIVRMTMGKLIVVWMVFLMLFCIWFLNVIPVVAQQESDIFYDNFDGYQSGSFPSAGGWLIAFNGRGDRYQVVTETYRYSGSKSFQLWGQTGWSAVVERRFSSTARYIGYEFFILIESRGSGHVDHPGFFNKDAATWGAYYATVLFDHSDGKIKAEDGTILGSWDPGTWYRVKVILDRETNKYSVYINNELVGENFRTTRTDTNNINAIALTSAWPGQRVYYDDVRVFSVTPQTTITVTKTVTVTVATTVITTSATTFTATVVQPTTTTTTVSFITTMVQPATVTTTVYIQQPTQTQLQQTQPPYELAMIPLIAAAAIVAILLMIRKRVEMQD